MIFYMPQKIDIEPWLSVSLFIVLCSHMPVKLRTRKISTGHLEVKSTLTVILLREGNCPVWQLGEGVLFEKLAPSCARPNMF
jgi:hypothetical protein